MFSHMCAHILYTPRKFKRFVSAVLKVLKAKSLDGTSAEVRLSDVWIDCAVEQLFTGHFRESNTYSI